MYTSTLNEPFGLILTNTGAERSISDIPSGEMVDMLNEHKAVLMRGFRPLPGDAFIAFAKRFGPLLNWEFGEILNLRIEKKPANHIFSSGRVEMHWDGAYLTDAPRFGVFQCLESTSGAEGGETLFTDTVKLLKEASATDRKRWEGLRISYSTEKVAHFGGAMTVPLVSSHPHTGEAVVRFIEPYNEDNMEINPIQVRVEDMPEAEQEPFLRDFTQRLYAPEYMYHHSWRKGDFLIADNNALLHGRSTLKQNIRRHLQRIHILEGVENGISRVPVFLGQRTADIHV